MEADTMLFEENIIFLILKVMITFTGTLGMMGSTTKFRYVKEKPISIIIFASYFIYVIISSYAIICFFSYQHLLRVFLLTISCPAILLLHNMSDEPFPRLCIHPCNTHTCFFIYRRHHHTHKYCAARNGALRYPDASARLSACHPV